MQKPPGGGLDGNEPGNDVCRMEYFYDRKTGFSDRLTPYVTHTVLFALLVALPKVIAGATNGRLAPEIVVFPVAGALLGLCAWAVVRVWRKLFRPLGPSASYKVTEDR